MGLSVVIKGVTWLFEKYSTLVNTLFHTSASLGVRLASFLILLTSFGCLIALIPRFIRRLRLWWNQKCTSFTVAHLTLSSSPADDSAGVGKIAVSLTQQRTPRDPR